MPTKKRKGERPDGYIQVTLTIGRKPDGKPNRKTFYGKTRAEAERKREQYKEQINRKRKFRQDITVGEWIEIFKGTYREKVDPAYLHIDSVPYNRLSNRIGPMRMIDVTEADLQAALNETRGMSFSTCNTYRQAIRRVFERARKNKIIPDNPAEDLVMPPYTKGTHRALETWEVDLIRKYWHEPGLVAGPWIMLMLLCGLRRGEMMGLDWSSVDLENGLLTVHEVTQVSRGHNIASPKTKTEAGTRIIPICQPLAECLQTIRRKNAAGKVCRSASGKPLTESAVFSGMKVFCDSIERLINGEPLHMPGRRTDLKKDSPDRKRFHFTCHDLRHTFATFLYDAGVDVKAAQYFLGHADIRMTLDLYTHLSKEREAASRNQAIRYLDALLDDRLKNAVRLPGRVENLGMGGVKSGEKEPEKIF